MVEIYSILVLVSLSCSQ